MKGGHFRPGLAYVAFSRIKTLNGLYLINFSPSAITCSKKVKEEIENLATNLLPPLQKPRCPSLPKPAYTTIALLNIKSIQPKLCDIEQDPITRVIDIFCITETWLSPSRPSPSLKPNHVIFRHDRHAQNHKGGVLLSAHVSYPVQKHIPLPSNIECLSLRFALPGQHNLLVFTSDCTFFKGIVSRY